MELKRKITSDDLMDNN